jgi:hypothetical protein
MNEALIDGITSNVYPEYALLDFEAAPVCSPRSTPVPRPHMASRLVMPQSRVRFIGSRELHRDLPKVLESLENPDARYVLTIHSKPKAVLIGAEAFLDILRGTCPQDRLLALQLGALVQGLEGSNTASEAPVIEELEEELVSV